MIQASDGGSSYQIKHKSMVFNTDKTYKFWENQRALLWTKLQAMAICANLDNLVLENFPVAPTKVGNSMVSSTDESYTFLRKSEGIFMN